MRLTLQDRFILMNHLIPQKGDWVTIQVCSGTKKKLKLTSGELEQLTQRQKDKLPLWDDEFNPEVDIDLTTSELTKINNYIDQLDKEKGIELSFADTILKIKGE